LGELFRHLEDCFDSLHVGERHVVEAARASPYGVFLAEDSSSRFDMLLDYGFK